MVLGAALLQPGTAFAQDQAAQPDQTKPISETTSPQAATSDTVPSNAIIVTGIRRALQNAAQRKRNADTVVDSITATDIGAFPDKSVAEALQRIPGITVDRIAAHGDVSHFSAEPSGVIIRGLPQVRSEFNGRDIFSANSSRGLSWSDVTPELLAQKRKVGIPLLRDNREIDAGHDSGQVDVGKHQAQIAANLLQNQSSRLPGVALNAHDPFFDRRLLVRLRIVKHLFQARFDFVLRR